MERFIVQMSSYKLEPRDELKKRYDGGVMDLFDGRPWERHSSCKNIDETPGEREFLLASIPKERLGKRIDSIWDDLALHFDKLGYRFAIEVELDAFAKARSDLQHKRIFALGSSVLRGGGRRYVAAMHEHSGGRWLGGHWFVDGVLGIDHLLLVRK